MKCIMDLYIFIFTVIASATSFGIVGVIIFSYLFLFTRIRSAFWFLISSAGVVFSTIMFKELTEVPRPDTALVSVSGYAFPSGHAAGIIFLAIVLMFLTRNAPHVTRIAVYGVSGATALTVGLSRIYLEVHTLPQVLAGFLLGAFWALVFIVLQAPTQKSEET